MAAARPSSSPSPTRSRTFAGTLSALGAKLNRTFSGDADTLKEDDGSDTFSIASTIDKNQADRSLSRGREVFSSGRGGAGNIRPSSVSRTRPIDGPDDFSPSRGREPAPTASPRSFSIGRGGAGNMRSPSRDVRNNLGTPDLIEEERVVRAHLAATQDAPVSSGRGGAGNITARSRSRDPTSPNGGTPLRSTGRGGAGNIVLGKDGAGAFVAEQEERKNHHHRDGVHSTGRGGAANISHLSEPPVEHHLHPHSHVESHGRGGAGNISRDRSIGRA